MRGEDDRETDAFRRMYQQACEYLGRFPWCGKIKDGFFGGGLADVVAVFLFQIEPHAGADEWIWVVEGDLPAAYLVPDRAVTPAGALDVYCDLMEEWVDAVREGRPLDDVFPVGVEASLEHADMLQSRVDFLRGRVRPILWPAN